MSTSVCMRCHRVIMLQGAVQQCRDGVVVGFTCGKSMQSTCELTAKDRAARPGYYRSLKVIARGALAESKQPTTPAEPDDVDAPGITS